MSDIDLFDDPTTQDSTSRADLFNAHIAEAESTARLAIPVTPDPAYAPPPTDSPLNPTDVFAGAEPQTARGTTPLPEAVPFTPREVQPQETVQGQFTDLFAQDNPIMELATQRQLRRENKRGLLNTGQGQRRGELSGMEAGLEIAGKDAAIYARAAELNQSYEEAAELAEQSFQHNQYLNQQLQDNASALSYQEFAQGIQASMQTFKEQSALMLQELGNTLDLSDQEQRETLEQMTLKHEQTVAEIEAEGELAKDSALEQIAAKGAIDMAQLIKSSDLTIDQLIAKGAIDIGNILTQMGEQHGYVIAEMIKGGEITIDQLVKQGDIDLVLIKAQVAVEHENKVLEMILQKDLNIDQIAAQGGIDKDMLLTQIGAQLTADQQRMLLDNTLTLGQLVKQGDIDMGLLTEKMSTEQVNAIERMLLGQDLTIDQMVKQAGIDKDMLLTQIETQLSADEYRMLLADEITLGQLIEQGSIDSGLLAQRLGGEQANTLEQMLLGQDLTLEQMAEQGGIDKDMLLTQIETQLSADEYKMLLADEITLGQLIEQGTIDSGLLAQRLGGEQANTLEQMYLNDEMTLNQMMEQGLIDKDNMADRIQTQLSADQSMAHTANEFNMSLSEFQNGLAILRDAQQSILNREEMGVQLGNDIRILEKQTAAAITLSGVDFFEDQEMVDLQSLAQIKLLREQGILEGDRMEHALDLLREEILAREDSATILSGLDFEEAKKLADKQGEVEENLIGTRSDMQIIEDNSRFANRLIEIQAQTAAQAQSSAETNARQLQTNYLLESGALMRQAIQEIGVINTTEGLTPEQQTAAINVVKTQLEENLAFTQTLYESAPGWDPGWGVPSPPADLFPPNEPPTEPPEDRYPEKPPKEYPPDDLYPVTPAPGPQPGGPTPTPSPGQGPGTPPPWWKG